MLFILGVSPTLKQDSKATPIVEYKNDGILEGMM
jgi:hypothetical protein